MHGNIWRERSYARLWSIKSRLFPAEKKEGIPFESSRLLHHSFHAQVDAGQWSDWCCTTDCNKLDNVRSKDELHNNRISVHTKWSMYRLNSSCHSLLGHERDKSSVSSICSFSINSSTEIRLRFDRSESWLIVNEWERNVSRFKIELSKEWWRGWEY